MLETADFKKYVFNTPSYKKWQRIGITRRAGVVVPLFSVYSKDSLGIGDFADLRLIVDWAKKTGNSIIQLLPLNEMGGIFCPYHALSSFALEAMYISLRLIRLTRKYPIKNTVDEMRNKFPVGKEYVDYRIKQEKVRLLWEIFQKETASDLREFSRFQDDNAYWLPDFALFKVIKEYQSQKPWYEWEDKYKGRNPYQLEVFRKEHQQEILFQAWVQWQLYRQLKDAKAYANKKGVLLKGDLPLLVSLDSADVWSHPELFKLDFSSGAPPDMYCAKGQRWGMPVYNWERIADDNYSYLKEKLRYAQEFYDILRIDHVVGLFRIWSIPYNEPIENKGLHGVFDPADENKWQPHGENILQVILNNTAMLLCAEDLGLVPNSCRETLKELGILGNDVQRWAKDWKIKHNFLSPTDYRILSVAMLSTHDTTNWPAWWGNEAGTVDEELFRRKCSERKIDYAIVRDKLFDASLSRHGRLRWLNAINSVDRLIDVLGKDKEELADFIDTYENSYAEKEKLWLHLGLSGPMREEPDSEIIKSALKITLGSSSIFCIELITDWLSMAEVLKGDPYQYRINTPGIISEKNWSWVMPIALEDLLRHPANKEIRKMIIAAKRA